MKEMFFILLFFNASLNLKEVNKTKKESSIEEILIKTNFFVFSNDCNLLDKKKYFIDKKYIKLEGFASEIITKIKIRNGRIKTCLIFCYDWSHVQWLEVTEVVIINKIEKLVLQGFASKIITKINIPNNVMMLFVICDSFDQIDWIKQIKKKIKIMNISKILFYNFASYLIEKLNIERKTIEEIIINVDKDLKKPKEKDSRGEIEIKKIKKIKLNGYSSRIIKKLELGKGKNEVLIVSCYKKKQINWLNYEKESIKVFNMSIIHLEHFASKIITNLNLSKGSLKKLVINCDEKEHFQWIYNFKSNSFLNGLEEEFLWDKEFVLVNVSKRDLSCYFISKELLTDQQVKILTEKEIEALIARQVISLTEKQLKMLSKEQFFSLIYKKNSFLSSKQFSFFEPEQIGWIVPKNMKKISYKKLNVLNKEQIEVLRPETVSFIFLMFFPKKEFFYYLKKEQFQKIKINDLFHWKINIINFLLKNYLENFTLSQLSILIRRKKTLKKKNLKKIEKEIEKRKNNKEEMLVEEICSICFLNEEENDLFTKTKCNHFFHRRCLLEWINYRKKKEEEVNCPVCRRKRKDFLKKNFN